MKILFVNLGLLIFSLGAALGAGELAVRWFFPLATTRLQKDKYAQGGIGFVPRATWTYEEPEFTERVAINSLGYRDEEIDMGRGTIVFLGDSQTYGTGVQQGERTSDLLRALLDRACPALNLNVLNAAMPGACTAEELRFLEDLQAKGVKVDHVFLFTVSNDHAENAKIESAPRAAAPVTEGSLHDDFRSSLSRKVKEFRYSSHLAILAFRGLAETEWARNLYLDLKYEAGLGELLAINEVYYDGPEIRKQLRSTRHYMADLKRLGRLTVVSVPDRYRYSGELRSRVTRSLERLGKDREHIDFDVESRLLAEMADELGVDYLDPVETFRRQERPELLSYPINGHMTPLAHRLLAEAIFGQADFFRSNCRLETTIS